MSTFTRGQQVWSKKLNSCLQWGTSGNGVARYPTYLVIRKAARDYHCQDCNAIVSKGNLHGGTFYDHFCLNCVTTERVTEFIPNNPKVTA